jgi:hypothetical protein
MSVTVVGRLAEPDSDGGRRLRGYPVDEANHDTIRGWVHSMRTIGAGPLSLRRGRSLGQRAQGMA